MLHNFVAIYVPRTLKGNIPMSDETHTLTVRAVASQLSNKCGGASSYPVTGYWESPELGLIEEHVTIVKSFYEGDSAEVIEFARHIAQGLKDEFEQEAVTLETEEGIDFI